MKALNLVKVTENNIYYVINSIALPAGRSACVFIWKMPHHT